MIYRHRRYNTTYSATEAVLRRQNYASTNNYYLLHNNIKLFYTLDRRKYHRHQIGLDCLKNELGDITDELR